MLSFNYFMLNNTLHLNLIGELNAKTCYDFEAYLKKLFLQKIFEGIILDFSGLSNITCDGLKSLVIFAELSEAKCRRYGIVHCSDKVALLLRVSGISKVIPFFSS